MNKIVIIGSGGAGKSTLARELGKKLNIEVFHLDSLFWKPNWVGIRKEKQRDIQTELVKKEKWIIDGNYGSTMDIRLKAADTILFLDFSRVLCTYRVLKRFIQYRNKTRPDMGEGCKEHIDLNFIKWVWNFSKNKKPAILEKLNRWCSNKNVIRLKSPKAARKFLNNIDTNNSK